MDSKFIQLHSPHLYGYLTRTYSEDDLEYLTKAFKISIEHGGLRELDFEREPGVSYNPRPARIGIILLSECKVNDRQILATAFLASVLQYQPNAVETVRTAFPELYDIALKSSFKPDKIERNSKSMPIHLISGVLAIDRARHLHLAKDISISTIQQFIKDLDIQIELAKTCSPRLEILLTSWKQRYERYRQL
jgi:hypothetical protein